MKICLTGSTGFVGSKLCTHLLENSHEIFAPVRNYNLASLPIHKNLKYVHVDDKSENKNYSKSLFNTDLVIHCAARAHVMKENESDSLHLYRKVNVDDTFNLAKQAASYGVKRFIFLSSVKVHGEQTTYSKSFKYNDIPKPEDAYGISKYEAEKALKEFSNQTEMQIVIIRAPLVYGEGVKGNFLRLLDLSNKGIPLPLANINNKRSLVGIDNLIDLIKCCINHPRATGETFLVSDKENISTTELITKIKIAMGKSLRLFPVPEILLKLSARLIGKSSEIDRLLGSLTVNISHTCDVLDWKPKFSLDHNLKKTVNWYLKNL